MIRRLLGRPDPAPVGWQYRGRDYWTSPVPWCAESLLMALPEADWRRHRRAEWAAGLPGLPPLPVRAAEVAGPGGTAARVLVAPMVSGPTTLTVSDRGRAVRRVKVAVLSRAEFGAGIRASAGATVTLAGRSVAARRAAGRDVEAVTISLSLRSRYALWPWAAGGEVRLDWLDKRGAVVRSASVAVAESAFARRRLDLAVQLPGPLPPGQSRFAWSVGGSAVARTTLVGLSRRRFRDSIRLVEVGFALERNGERAAVRALPPQYRGPAAPRFVVKSGLSGAAGVAPFAVRPTGPAPPTGAGWAVAIVVGDRDAEVSPALSEMPPNPAWTGFELRLGPRALGQAALCPVPSARIDAEGGFKPPPEFDWSSAADDELLERLAKLGPDGA